MESLLVGWVLKNCDYIAPLQVYGAKSERLCTTCASDKHQPRVTLLYGPKDHVA